MPQFMLSPQDEMKDPTPIDLKLDCRDVWNLVTILEFAFKDVRKDGESTHIIGDLVEKLEAQAPDFRSMAGY